MISLLANSIAFVLFSLFSESTQEELKAADECMSDSPVQPYQGELLARSVTEMKSSMDLAIGESASTRQIQLALSELFFARDERRPFALMKIRNQVESNLASFVGQTIAHRIVTGFLPFKKDESGHNTIESVHNMESRFENYQSQLTGLAAELDNLRRYHRQILQDLPTAVCSVNREHKVLTWNRAIEELTQIPASIIVDNNLESLPSDWYLQVCGEINRMYKGERTVVGTLPIAPNALPVITSWLKTTVCTRKRTDRSGCQYINSPAFV